MREAYLLFGAGVVIVAGVIMYPKPVNQGDKTAIIQMSLDKQNRLVSLTENQIIEATSSRAQWGMFGEVTTVAKVSFDWSVDLSQAKVTKEVEGYRVTLPRPVRSEAHMSEVKNYSNGSWMFTVDGVREGLIAENMGKISAQVGSGNEKLARDNARDNVRGLIEGVGVKIVVD